MYEKVRKNITLQSYSDYCFSKSQTKSLEQSFEQSLEEQISNDHQRHVGMSTLVGVSRNLEPYILIQWHLKLDYY